MTPEEKKEVKRLYDIEYRKKNKEKIAKYKAEWAKANPDIVLESKKRNIECKKMSDKRYAKEHKKRLNKYKSEWAKANPVKVRKANRDYTKKKLATDPLYKLKHYISCNIRNSIRKNGYTKKSRTHEILGCTFEEFKTYIESQWEDWMNWDNYGNPKDGIFEPDKTWDIDHIVPISTAISESEVITLNHHTNFQPLCSYNNRWVKKNNIT